MTTPNLDSLATDKPHRRPITGDEIAAHVAALGARWSVADGALRLELPAKGMTKTGQVAAHAGALADEIDHHPTIVIEYPRLRLTINTHDVGGAITGFDVHFAARLEQWLRANGWPA